MALLLVLCGFLDGLRIMWDSLLKDLEDVALVAELLMLLLLDWYLPHLYTNVDFRIHLCFVLGVYLSPVG
jgi:hypothetical protein